VALAHPGGEPGCEDPPAGAGPTPSTAVFYRDRAGHLAETDDAGGAWNVSQLPGPANPGGALAAASVEVAGRPLTVVWTLSARRGLVEHTDGPRGWTRRTVVPAAGVAPDSPLAAVAPADARAPAVYFVDAAEHLAAAGPLAGPPPPGPGGLGPLGPGAGLATVPAGSGRWWVHQVSAARVDAAGGLLATNAVAPKGQLVPEVVALASSGRPLLDSWSADRWSTDTLPGDASSLVGLAAYAIPGATQRLVVQDAAGLAVDTDAGDAGYWVTSALPGSPVTFPGRVLLYAADPTDLDAAFQAAAAAGLGASQVTGDFATAWADALSGDYLVIAVGGPANSALYFNVCGWSNPSDAFAGSTPFNLVGPPLDALPGADNFEEASGATGADTAALAIDLAYDAVHGSYPPGVSGLPTEAGVAFACAGEPSVPTGT